VRTTHQETPNVHPITRPSRQHPTGVFGHWSWREKLKDSPFDMSVLDDISWTRNTKAEEQYVNGWDNSVFVYNKYTYKKHDQFMLENALETYDNNSQTEKTSMMYRTALYYSRVEVLNEKQHGINFSPGLDIRYYHQTMRDMKSAYGHIRADFKVSKTVLKNGSIEGELRINRNFVSKEETGKVRNYNEFLLTPSYKITDKFSFALQFDYYALYTYDKDVNNTYVNNAMDIYILPIYSLSPRVEINPYLKFDTVIQSRDQKFFRTGAWKYPVLGIVVSASIF
ncbi:MAG: hypothetical protein WCG27_10155, partial [Pseudomonadota bacterium]